VRQPSEKLMSLETVLVHSEDLKAEKKQIITTNGCFDILHRGHVQYLSEARNLGDALFVGLNSDQSVKQLKGDDRPLNNETDRQFCLAALESIDGVFIFNEATPLGWLKKLKPHIHVKGSDYKGKDIPEKIIETWGGKLKFIDFVEGQSTTSLINLIKTLS